MSVEPQIMKKVQDYQQHFSKEKDVQRSISLLMQQLTKRSSRQLDSNYIENLLHSLEREKDKSVLDNQLAIVWNSLSNPALKLDSLVSTKILPLVLRHFYPEQQEDLLCTCTGMLASLTTSSTLVNEVEQLHPSFLEKNCLPLLQQMEWSQTPVHKTTEKLACYLLLLCNNWTVAKPSTRKLFLNKDTFTLLLSLFAEKTKLQTVVTEDVAEKAALLLLSLSMDDSCSSLMRQYRGIQKLVSYIFDVKENVLKRETSKSTLKIGHVLWNLSLDEANIPILEETGGFIALLLLLPQTQTETDVSWIKTQKTKKPKHQKDKREPKEETISKEDQTDVETKMRNIISGDLHKNIRVQKLGQLNEYEEKVEPPVENDSKRITRSSTPAIPKEEKAVEQVPRTSTISTPVKKQEEMSQVELVRQQQHELEKRQREFETNPLSHQARKENPTSTSDTNENTNVENEEMPVIPPAPLLPSPSLSLPTPPTAPVLKNRRENDENLSRSPNAIRKGTFLSQVKAGIQLKSAIERVLSEKKVQLPPTAHEQVRQFLEEKFKHARPQREEESESEESPNDWE